MKKNIQSQNAVFQVRFKACKFWNENENMRILFKWVAKSKDSSIRTLWSAQEKKKIG
jgi:hypothetical protein